ncbi:hypothetical protein E2562_003166 [Oryza meyeriana var. granulata]|uniref:Uncharacterized protein n=1 Tax=Oryza meyeriana var. granulata TaxID=110450 RepID=A0A6G1EUN5_9ORYZ|nr:hypothetical protein E2562_003166 [Oryza meyeriana var. granulata]
MPPAPPPAAPPPASPSAAVACSLSGRRRLLPLRRPCTVQRGDAEEDAAWAQPVRRPPPPLALPAPPRPPPPAAACSPSAAAACSPSGRRRLLPPPPPLRSLELAQESMGMDLGEIGREAAVPKRSFEVWERAREGISVAFAVADAWKKETFNNFPIYLQMVIIPPEAPSEG